jgi:RNA polymerase sporulation-specific sigma factor
MKYAKGTGLELSDLIQEGMLGFSDAIYNFQNDKETIFYTYAKTCVEIKILSQVISTTRLKRRILNESISIEASEEYEGVNINQFLKDERENPETLLISDEYINELVKKAEDVLTSFELAVFELKINNFEYKEIAEILDKDIKSIDNALQRIKVKMRNILEKDE